MDGTQPAGSVAELAAMLERRAAEAERIGATAPVANIYRAVVEELRPLVGNGNGAAPLARVPDHGIAAPQVAEILGTSVRWVYDHADELGGQKLSRRCLRFPEAAVRRRVERRR